MDFGFGLFVFCLMVTRLRLFDTPLFCDGSGRQRWNSHVPIADITHTRPLVQTEWHDLNYQRCEQSLYLRGNAPRGFARSLVLPGRCGRLIKSLLPPPLYCDGCQAVTIPSVIIVVAPPPSSTSSLS
jgi:hypothetical protein